MFILSLTDKAEPSEAGRHMETPPAGVKSGYDTGIFPASGRWNPKTGGIIPARGERTEIETRVAADPFTVHGIAGYEITEFIATTTAPGLEGLKL